MVIIIPQQDLLDGVRGRRTARRAVRMRCGASQLLPAMPPD